MVRSPPEDDQQLLSERVWPIHPLLTRALPFGLIVLAVYWPSLNGAFLWDDIMFISDNELVKQPGGLAKIWFSTASTDFWPVSYTVFWLIWQSFGAWTLPYHLTALAIHLANVLLVERVLLKLGLAGATWAALVFAVHPVNVESVAWIFQIKTTLSATFALVALHAWLGGRFGPSVASFALGLLTKTSIVTWPLVMLDASWWSRGRITRAELGRVAPFLALSLATGLVGLFWYRYGELTGGERVRTDHGVETLLIAARAFWFYLGKAVWPWPLVFVYPRWTIDTADWTAYLPLAGLLLFPLAAGYAFVRKHARGPLAFFVYVFATLFPVLGFADVYFFRFSFVADHYQYLALIAPAAVIGALLTRAPRRLGLAVGGGLVVLLAGLSHVRAAVYRDEPSVWRDTLERNPTAWLALYNSGNIAYGEHRLDEALDLYTRAVGVKPDYVDGWVGLGAAHLAHGDLVHAEACFRRALELFPGQARALNNLAAMAANRGDWTAAARHLEEATRHLPDYALGYKNLGLAYVRLADPARAKAAFERARELRPDDAEVEANLERLQRAP